MNYTDIEIGKLYKLKHKRKDYLNLTIFTRLEKGNGYIDSTLGLTGKVFRTYTGSAHNELADWDIYEATHEETRWFYECKEADKYIEFKNLFYEIY